MAAKHEVIFCIVNAGFSDVVMDAAKEVGARGGTVIHARGTANKEAEQFFHITIQPDKDVVMILVPTEIKDAVLHALYRNAGLKTDGQGIAFSMPVNHVVGLSQAPKTEESEPAKTEKENKETADTATEPTPAEEDKPEETK